MNLMELQKVLGERVKVTLQEDLTPEQRQIENEQSALVSDLAKQMINNADLILRAEKLQAQTKSLVVSHTMELING